MTKRKKLETGVISREEFEKMPDSPQMPLLKKEHKKPSDEILEHVTMSCAGIFQAMATKLGVDRRTVERWFQKDPWLQEVRRHARESIIDMAEAELVKMVKKGEMVPVLFTLKTIGKDRGYVEREENDVRQIVHVKIEE